MIPHRSPFLSKQSIHTFSSSTTGVLINAFELQAPNVRGKTVTDSSDLLVLLSFNIAYDSRVFPSERQRLNLAGCYLVLAYTGCRPAEVVNGDKNMPLDGS